DVVSWDSYPTWHDQGGDEAVQAARVAMMHDIIRSIKGGQPWMLMESTPSLTNWQPVSKLKRPGMHLLSSMQAVAHGSDTVQYFQWRKSRGSSEKLHGAVVDHVGHEHTRVFSDVAEV
ncbi:beta-galactosidase, partial [Mycobacterium kansasii]